MVILEKYDKISKKIIDESKVSQEFNNCMNEKLEQINNYRINKSKIFKLIHPITTIKNRKEYTRLILAKNKYNKFYNDSVLLYVVEETGDIEEDLEYAARVEKPKYIERETKILIKKIKK